MTAPEAAPAGPEPAAPGTWKITGGQPDAVQTAAVLAVLTALLSRARPPAPDPEPERTAAHHWARTARTARTFSHPGTWRRH
ncbi:acyl-CoA carboxylase subunit epsilon [Streptomyces sp. NPDC003038]|uniref:acyl-CoA carboxylase subunit epsilon n=1 Tax=unclassified Streptomyces TaxID=2593676 RepID=UPI0033B15945